MDPLLCKQIKVFICQSPVTDSWLPGVTGNRNWNRTNRFPLALCYKEPHVLSQGLTASSKAEYWGGAKWPCRVPVLLLCPPVVVFAALF